MSYHQNLDIVAEMPRPTRRRKPTFSIRQLKIVRVTAKKIFEEQFKGGESPQRKMALALGLSQTTISALLAGTYVPSVRVADEIATLAGYDSLRELIGPYGTHGESEDAPEPPSSGRTLRTPAAYPNLIKCVQFHGDEHWPSYVIAAAKAGYYPDDVNPKEWVTRLDSLKKLLKPPS